MERQFRSVAKITTIRFVEIFIAIYSFPRPLVPRPVYIIRCFCYFPSARFYPAPRLFCFSYVYSFRIFAPPTCGSFKFINYRASGPFFPFPSLSRPSASVVPPYFRDRQKNQPRFLFGGKI